MRIEGCQGFPRQGIHKFTIDEQLVPDGRIQTNGFLDIGQIHGNP
jgi:hypothetical protein